MDDYCETEGELVKTKERIAYLPQELPKENGHYQSVSFYGRGELWSRHQNARADGGKISCPADFFTGSSHGNTVGGEKVKAQMMKLLRRSRQFFCWMNRPMTLMETLEMVRAVHPKLETYWYAVYFA